MIEDLFIIKRGGKYMVRLVSGFTTKYNWIEDRDKATKLTDYQAKIINKTLLGTIIKLVPES